MIRSAAGTDRADAPASRATALIYLIAAGAVLLRLAPFFRAGGPLSWPVDYDEGVYFSAAALLGRGILPYRDFAFVHPPGLLYFLGVTAWPRVDLSHAFAAARVVAAFVGGANVLLAGRIASRARGAFAGLVAAALYATYPDVVMVERGPYLEPVLNLACLGLAYVWLRPSEGRARNPIIAGLLCGAACAVKVWGGIWLLASLASLPKRGLRNDAPKFIAAAAAAGLLLVAPLALPAPRQFIEETLLFHAWRPPDGVIARAARLPEIAGGGHIVTTVLAVFALAAIAAALIRRREVERDERFFAVAALLTLVAFFASSSYWSQYNSHLAASECVLAGIGAATLHDRAARFLSKRALQIVSVLALLLLPAPSLVRSIAASHARAPELLTLARTIRETVAPEDCLFTFDPTWSIAAGRLPPHDAAAPVIVDVYGAMLLDAVRGGRKFPDAETAFHTPAAQRNVRARLERCRFAIFGWRGNWQLSAESREWYRSHFICQAPSTVDLCLFERWTPSHLGLVFVAEGQQVTFGDGWYPLEGTPRQSWRWMGARAVTTLPAAAGRVGLQLELEIPSLPQAPALTVSVDDHVIDHALMRTPIETRSYEVVVDDRPAHTLVITTDETFNPSRVTHSSDDRELGVRLNRLVWIPATRSSASLRGDACCGAAAATSSPR